MLRLRSVFVDIRGVKGHMSAQKPSTWGCTFALTLEYGGKKVC
jgi:hypothetical protein